jgi:hypothetical protein
VAGPNQSDQLAECHLALLDLYRASGLARQRVGFDGAGLARMAKYSGQTEDAVTAQLSGEAEPMPGQALALVRALRLAGAAGNGAAP